MTPERKIERIRKLFTGLEVDDMTTLELQIYTVLKDEEPTGKQREQAKSNSSAVIDG